MEFKIDLSVNICTILSMYKINPKILKTPIEQGNILLLEPDAGLYFELNQVSVVVYQGISLGLAEEEILDEITNTFEVKKQQAKKDMLKLIDQLLENKIILR